MSKISPSADLRKLYALLEEALTAYKGIEISETRDMFAFELVEVSARLVNGLLMERSAGRLQGAIKEERLALCLAYNADSLGIAAGNIAKLRGAATAVAV